MCLAQTTTAEDVEKLRLITNISGRTDLKMFSFGRDYNNKRENRTIASVKSVRFLLLDI